MGCVTLMFISSPVVIRKSKLLFRSSTINTPVLVVAILLQAETIMSTSVSSPVSAFKKLRCFKKFRRLLKFVEPTINRNFLISG